MNSMIDELLNRWEESDEQGQPLTPEELCRDHPELLDELKFQIKALAAVDAKFGSSAIGEESAANKQVTASKLHQRLRISTEFQIDRLHASGGLGEVYLAKEPLLDRTVAIKFPRVERMSVEQLARFEREAQVTGKLNHPGIVPVHAMNSTDGQPCYVMRFIDGPTLEHRIELLFGGPEATKADFYASLEMRQLLQSFVTLCNIVAYAHEHGIVHRDIKPANIILGPFGETMLMDWGLAKILGEVERVSPGVPVSDSTDTVVDPAVKTRAGQFMGTPAYASPEQRRGQLDLLDTRTDVYSLGATLFTLLTGSLPSHDAIQASTLRCRVGTVVPRRLVAICRKALAEDVDRRYASVVRLREDIERYLAGEPISVVAETVWSRLSRTVRRRSGWAAAILVGVSMTVIAGSISGMLLSQKNLELQTTNQQLATANAKSLASQQRATATTDLLTKAMRAATPDVAQGKEPTVRQLLDETSERLRTDRSIVPLVAADTHQVLAEAYVSLGTYDAAQQNADLAAQLYREHAGENSAEALHSQATRALVLSRRDQDEEAIRVSLDALERGRAVKDLDAETMVVLIDTYGHACLVGPAPNPDELKALSREAYDLALKKLGPEHRVTLRAGTNLAVDLMNHGDLEEAEPLLFAVHQAHERLLGKAHPETLVDTFNMIVLLHGKREFQAGVDLARSKLPLFEEVLGLEHQRTVRLLILIAELELNVGNMEAAQKECRLALSRATKGLGPVHQQAFEARGILITALLALKQIEEADSLAQEQYDQSLATYGESHIMTVQSTTLLFDVAGAKGDIEAMEKWFEKLRGSEWEQLALEDLRKAKEKKASMP